MNCELDKVKTSLSGGGGGCTPDVYCRVVLTGTGRGECCRVVLEAGVGSHVDSSCRSPSP